MKSCLGLLFAALVLALLVLVGALWQLNHTTEVTRREAAATR